MKSETILNAERQRLEAQRQGKEDWRLWGPYLAERAWGTVREDYSAYGSAWEYFDHDQARSRAYRWNEDGMGGLCDEHQRLCFALALWNGRDPILKERAFGLTGNQGNHGEDVKEYYFYLDATPSHSWLRYLYKYPQAAYPYAQLVQENGRRSEHLGWTRNDSVGELTYTVSASAFMGRRASDDRVVTTESDLGSGSLLRQQQEQSAGDQWPGNQRPDGSPRHQAVDRPGHLPGTDSGEQPQSGRVLPLQPGLTGSLVAVEQE